MSFKPLPVATENSQPFWDSLREHNIKIQHCQDCDGWVFYPRKHCSHCLSPNLAWQAVSGRCSLHSYTISRVPTLAEFADETPQKLAVVQFDEGPCINTTLVYLDEADIEIGMALKPVFDDVKGEETTLLRFTGLHCEPPAAEQEEQVVEPEIVKEIITKKFKYDDIDALQSLVSDTYTDWSPQVTVTQEMINQFAELSGDDYWIHVDVEKAKQMSPFGNTIAQGMMVMALVAKMPMPLNYELVGFNNMLNYGSSKIRFANPVVTGSKIHARSRVIAVKGGNAGTQLTMEINVHVVGQDRPTLVNELIIMYM